MARDATARLYDVDEDSVVLTKLGRSEKYDQGTITFRAKPGALVDLMKLHESIWATRLSGGTRSGLVKIEVTASGRVRTDGAGFRLTVQDSEDAFVLGEDPQLDTTGRSSILDQLHQAAASDSLVEVTGRLDGWSGRWPDVLREPPDKPIRILVSNLETTAASP